MLVELLSSANYVSFNIKLAEILGLNAAIYLSALLDINEKAFRKEKIDEDGFFKIEREYLRKRTTFDTASQKEIESFLCKLGIIDVVAPNGIKIIMNSLTDIMINPNDKLISEVKKASEKKEKESAEDRKINRMRENARSRLITTDPDLRSAYCEWIDAVLLKFGFISNTAVTSAECKVDSFTNRNKQIALDIINIASVNCWKDMEYGIQEYKKRHGTPLFVPQPVNSIPIPEYKKLSLTNEVF